MHGNEKNIIDESCFTFSLTWPNIHNLLAAYVCSLLYTDTVGRSGVRENERILHKPVVKISVRRSIAWLRNELY